MGLRIRSVILASDYKLLASDCKLLASDYKLLASGYKLLEDILPTVIIIMARRDKHVEYTVLSLTRHGDNNTNERKSTTVSETTTQMRETAQLYRTQQHK